MRLTADSNILRLDGIISYSAPFVFLDIDDSREITSGLRGERFKHNILCDRYIQSAFRYCLNRKSGGVALALEETKEYLARCFEKELSKREYDGKRRFVILDLKVKK